MLRTPLIAIALISLAAPALAQAADSVVEAARSSGKVGEQADGYLGLTAGGDADLKSRVDQINIKRRAVYTDLAAKRGVTITEVAAATACQLFRDRVAPGQFYRAENGQWTQRQGGAPMVMPSFCGG